jgi:hypothetical protein
MPCGASLEIGWIPVRRTVDRDQDLESADHLDVHIRLLPILETKDQTEILEEELIERGWVKQPDGALTKTFGDVEARLEPGGMAVRIAVSTERSIKATATVEGRAKEEDIAAQDAIGNRAAREAEVKLDLKRREAEAEMIQENIGRLEKARETLEPEIAEVVTATTRRAIRQRAQQLGSIQSETEQRGEHGLEVTIVVRT